MAEQGISHEHPKGLYLLFTVEMWERFSFYGMRALLTLYMIKALRFSLETSGQVYGWYTGLVYFSALGGGYLADRYLGTRRAIVIGGSLMALGHFLMAFPPLPCFFGALALLVIGNGLFKPNISTIVGKLYEPGDPRRDGGFTIFYMGINLGAFFAPLVCGALGEKVGWHWGFGAAGVGMVIGLLCFLWRQDLLGEHGLEPARKKQDESVPEVPLTPEEMQRMYVIFIMVGFSVFFWATFEQAGSSLTVFADRCTERMVSFLGWEFPASYFQSVNPLFIFLLAPWFAGLWQSLAEKKKEPSTPVKFAIALVMVALGFAVVMVADLVYQQSGKVSALWLILTYFFHTIGELCLSPVGLSMISKLAPAKFASLMMGTWFLSNFAANLVGGIFAGNFDSMNHFTFFMIPIGTTLAAALVLFLIRGRLKEWMHGIN